MGLVFGHIWVAQYRQIQAVLNIILAGFGSDGHPLSRHPHHCHDLSTLTALWSHSRYAHFPFLPIPAQLVSCITCKREASRALRAHQDDTTMFQLIIGILLNVVRDRSKHLFRQTVTFETYPELPVPPRPPRLWVVID